MQESFPRLRADRKSEQRAVFATLEMIASRLLPIRPANRQIVNARYRVIDDGAIPNCRPHHPVASDGEAIDERLQTFAGNDRPRPFC